jgi:hypothetical protein
MAYLRRRLTVELLRGGEAVGSAPAIAEGDAGEDDDDSGGSDGGGGGADGGSGGGDEVGDTLAPHLLYDISALAATCHLRTS